MANNPRWVDDLERQLARPNTARKQEQVAKAVLAGVATLGGIVGAMPGEWKRTKKRNRKMIHNPKKKKSQKTEAQEGTTAPKAVKEKMPKYGKRKRSRLPKGGRKKGGKKGRKKARGVNMSSVYRAFQRSLNTSKVQTVRGLNNAIYTTAVNVRDAFNLDFFRATDISNFIDATVPEIDGTGVTYNDLRQSNGIIDIVGGYIVITFANNYNYNTKVDMYMFRATDDTSVSCASHLNTELDLIAVDSSQVQILTAEDSLLYSYADVCKNVKKHWNCLRRKTFWLKPSEVRSVFFKVPRGSINLADKQIVGSAYLKNCTISCVWQQQGTIAHGAEADAQSANTGISDSKLDVVYKYELRFKARATTEIRRIEKYVETLDTMTNPNVTNMEIEEKTDVIG